MATDWQVVSSPNASGALNSELLGISCVTSSNCWAVGDATYPPSPLVEQYSAGTWGVVASADPAQGGELNAVTCVSATDCWAVGFSGTAGSATLIEAYGGTGWTINPSPSPGPTGDALNAVTCVSAGQCWAAGYSVSSVTTTPLIEQTYQPAPEPSMPFLSVATSPNPPGSPAAWLSGVSCVSDTDCWAVGYSEGTLIEQNAGSVSGQAIGPPTAK